MIGDAEAEDEAAEQEPAGLFGVANPAVEKGENEGLKEDVEGVYLGDDGLGPHALSEGEEETAGDAGGGAKEGLGAGIEGVGFFFEGAE